MNNQFSFPITYIKHEYIKCKMSLIVKHMINVVFYVTLLVITQDFYPIYDKLQNAVLQEHRRFLDNVNRSIRGYYRSKLEFKTPQLKD